MAGMVVGLVKQIVGMVEGLCETEGWDGCCISQTDGWDGC